ncbi:filamentous hemagglutinin N-terminal domain-containing protein [Scytonema sp. UIC 10036]|uniref:two-partner secretion domain-containing protein n=1 Tax=Scytonema sp. UIC 10036 TaxID=2304196 RepID=UPI00140FBBCB|nr:filamentous hemagglutinin N-terminal domain-containing protein [Scytonema sp. UIC 10036]
MFAKKSWAQIVQDETLGSESSIVTTIPDLSLDLIEGGARRNQNLFHSFQEFNVGEGRLVYFDNPIGITNILARVTGNNSSQILGYLGILGDANLFLINPNGIIFGRNAFLDLQGSFVASTANSLLFDNGFDFSTINPQTPPLLSVNIPIGLRFRTQPQPINVEGSGLLGNFFGLGLQVQPGKTLALVGGDVNLVNGSLIARGGRIELGGISEPGTVGLNLDRDNLSLSYPALGQRANLSLTGTAIDLNLDLNANTSGSLVINSNNLDYVGSIIQAGLPAGNALTNRRGADLFINATGKMTVADSVMTSSVDLGAIGNSGDININVGSFSASDNSFIVSTAEGQGNPGNVSIKASGLISLDRSRIFSAINDTARGNSGTITLDAQNISLSNGTRVSTSVLGRGNSGGIFLKANNEISVNNSFISSGVIGAEAEGNAGHINMEAGSVFLERATVSASTSGQGNAGKIFITANDLVSLSDRASLNSTVDFAARGDGGDINIQSSSLAVRNNASISSIAFGQGNSGNIFINAKKNVFLDNVSTISSGSFLGRDANGSIFVPENSNIFKGGNISLETGVLLLTNNSSLNASTIGFGNAGNIVVNSQTLVSLDNSEISTVASPTSQGLPQATGNAGDITVNVLSGSLSLLNGGRLQTATFTQGNAGKITAKARDSLSIRNEESLILSFATPAVDGATVGRGGDIQIQTGSFSISDAAKVISSTFGQQDSGNIQLEANLVSLDRGLLTTQTGSQIVPGNGGHAGGLRINTVILRVQNGGLVSSETFNSGKGGTLAVNATELVEVAGTSAIGNNSAITTATSGTGNAGDLQISTQRLLLQNQGIISASTLVNTGRGGTLRLNTRELVVQDGAKVAVSSQGGGNAGNIEISSPFILLDNKGAIAADTASGNGGNINLQNSDFIFMRRGSEISTSAGINRAPGDGGNITIGTNFLVAIPRENNDIKANSFGGRGGAININAQRVFGLEVRDRLTSLSDITAFSQFSPALNGEITLNTPDVDPSQGLVELPQTIVDPDALVAQNPCLRRAGSEFIVTGRGGLPPNPSQALSSEGVEVNLIEPVNSSHVTGKFSQFLSANQLSTQSSPEIVPATGWVINEKDEVIFTANHSRNSGDRAVGCAYPK